MQTKYRMIVGLGNPGKDYERTRHNAGFMLIDGFAKCQGITWKHEPSLRSMVGEGNVDGEKIILVKPTTYMNASGEAVKLALTRFHIEPSSLLVFSDDVDLPLGVSRFRAEGGAGGHNGMKSLISCLGTQQFARIKIGVGAPPSNVPLEVYVLEKFVRHEHGVIDRVIALLLDKLESDVPLEETTWTV